MSRAKLSGRGLVKICGLREVEHAVVATEAGADLLGFIFAPARRQVTSRQAAAMIAAARASREEPVLTVGVFVDAPAAVMNEAAAIAGLDMFQLAGSESPAMLAELSVPAIRVDRLPAGLSPAAAAAELAVWDVGDFKPVLHLIEGLHPGAHGGTGLRADWSLAAALAADEALGPVGLAGGLDPANVGAAIAEVRPWVVDVSSGVETDGVKDPARIRAFLREARTAFGALAPG